MDLIVTGIPRSGTTLMASLINSMLDSVCLSEPDWHVPWIDEAESAEEYVTMIKKDFNIIRDKLISGEEVVVRVAKKKSKLAGFFTRNRENLTNYFKRNRNNKMELNYNYAPLVKKGLTPSFLLAFKHNAHYTAVLPEILAKTDIPVLAVIRHPVPTILSWRSLELPITQGRLPAAEKFWPAIPQARAKTQDTLRVQVEIYDMFCERYAAYSDRITLIRYEDLISEPQAISRHLGREYKEEVSLKSGSRNPSYSWHEEEKIKDYIGSYSSHIRKYYPDDDLY